MTRYIGPAALAGFILTVVAANWLIERYGPVPVGFGLMAPAGVYAAGASFTFRDFVHETLGRRWVLVAIVTGAALSWLLSDGVTLPGGIASLAVASGVSTRPARRPSVAVSRRA